MAELKMASEAPSLRFAAAAQLGRLRVGRPLAAPAALESRRRGYRDVSARIAALSALSTDTPT